MAMSFSRPDPSSPTAVATASFATSRRGFEQGEVRDFLRMVAAELARLQEREKHLERELRNAQRASATHPAVALDDEVVTRMLGEEAARILQTAREAASQIKVRAEENASRTMREATDEAQRLREEAEIESVRRRQDAASDAESELEMAKQQGREMVNEARAYRERVLGELARRRELARQQIEQLVHGRDRLLQAFERARIAAVDVMAELTPLGAPNEYVNLSPTTGPVPLMIPADRRPEPPAEQPSAAVIDELLTEPDLEEPAAPEAEAESVVDTAEVDVVELHEVDLDASDGAEEAALDEEIEGEIDDALEEAEAEHADDADDLAEEADDDADDERPIAPVVSLFAGELPTPAGDATADEHDESPAPKASVDDLFARLRASRAATVVERAQAVADGEPAVVVDEVEPDSNLAPVAEPMAVDETRPLSVFEPSPVAPAEEVEADDTPFGQRDAALTPLIVASARKLKRVLADEQNDVLHALRRADAARSADKLLPKPGEHAERYAHAIEEELRHAALAGAASIDDREAAAHEREIVRSKALAPAVDALAAAIVTPLRERVERAVEQAGGDAGELSSSVRAIYREWKTQRIDEHLDDVLLTAFGRGAYVALSPGTPVCWTVDPHGPECPDAEDNALAGVVAAGQPFPTDHVCAPAHEGCRCMLVRVPR